MIHDAQLLFSDAQAITGSASVVSTNVVDLGIARDIGTGENLYVFVSVDVAFTAGGITVDVVLQGGATAGATTNSQTLFRMVALTTAGTIYYAKLDPSGMTNAQALVAGPLALRFIQLTYTVNGGTLTTGTVTAALAHGIQQVPHYATGIIVA